MPDFKYILRVDGKDHRVSQKNIEKYGMDAYARDYPGATIRMQDEDEEDYNIPLSEYQRATRSGLKPFLMEEEVSKRPITSMGLPSDEARQAFEASAPQSPADSRKPEQVQEVEQPISTGYEYKPEVQQHILQNMPDMFKPKKVDLGRGVVSGDETADEQYAKRIDMANTYNRSDEAMKRRKEEVGEHLHTLSGEVDAALDEVKEKINDRKRVLRSGAGNAIAQSRENTASDSVLAQHRGDRSYLQGAKELIEEAENIVDEAGRKGRTNFFGGLGRGFADVAFDPKTWTMGIGDMIGNMRLENVVEKYENGEKLSPSEEKLLDAAVTNMAVTAFYSSDLGRGYKAGNTFGESIPFMLEFAVNPVSASGEGLAKGILKYGMKKFANKELMRKGVSKAGARLLGDAAAAVGMEATTGLPRVISGAQERMFGNINFEIGNDGKLSYAGRTGQMDTKEAIGKSVASNFLENQSEMVFNAFNGFGKSLWKNVEGSLPGGVNRFMQSVKDGKVGQLYRELKSNPTLQEVAKRTQFHGLGEEYLEEVYNNLANIPLGEMTMDEALDLDRNIDTFLGLAPTSVVFGLLGMGGLAAQRSSHRRKMDAALESMSKQQQDKYSELERVSKEEGNEIIKQSIEETIKDESLTPQEKKQEIEYAWNIAKDNAMGGIEREQTEEATEKRTLGRERGAAIYQNHNPAEMRGAVIRERVAKGRLMEAAGMDENAVESLASASDEQRSQALDVMDENTRRIAEDYLEQRYTLNGLNDALDEAHASEVEAAQGKIQTMSPTGKVIVVELGRNGDKDHEYGIVLNGIDAEGNYVQPNRRLVVVPLETNNGVPDFDSFNESNAIFIAPQSGVTPSILEQNAILTGMLKDYQQDAGILDAPPIVPGQDYTLAANGETFNVSVLGMHPSMKWIVQEEGQEKPELLSEEELRAMMEEAEALPYLQEYAEEDRKAAENRQMAINNATKNIPQNGNNQSENIPNPSNDPMVGSQLTEEESNGDISGMEANTEVAPEKSVKKPADRLVRFPEGHERAGKPDYENSNPDDVRDYLVESLGVEGAGKSIRNQLTALQDQERKQDEKVRNDTEEVMNSLLGPDEMIEAKEFLSAEEQALASTRKSIDFWNNMLVLVGGREETAQQSSETPKQTKKSARRKPASYKPGKAYTEAKKRFSDSPDASDVLNDLTPRTPEELAAVFLSSGDMRLIPESLKGESGYANADLSRFVGLTARKENGGITVREAGDRLMQADREGETNILDQYDPNAGVNAILEALGNAQTMSDLYRMIENNRISQAEEIYRAEEDAIHETMDRAAWEEYGMSYEDLVKLNDAITAFIEERGNVVEEFMKSDEYMDLIHNFAETKIQEDGQERNDNTGLAASEGKASNDERQGNGGTPSQSNGSNDRVGTEVPETEIGGRGRSEEGITEVNHQLYAEAGSRETESGAGREVDENGYPFVVSSDGTTSFGEIRDESGLPAAPIKLSIGFNDKDKNGRNHGYGLNHIEASHGEQIRNAGFNSIEEFVESVAGGYDIIRKGNTRNGNDTYLVEVTDKNNNTLFVELSKDNSYWNVNSAGIFRKGYSRNKEIIWPLPAVEGSSTAKDLGVRNAADNGNSMSGDSPQTISSDSKDNASSPEKQTNATENRYIDVLAEAARIAKEREIEVARSMVDSNPTETQNNADGVVRERKGTYKSSNGKTTQFVQLSMFDNANPAEQLSLFGDSRPSEEAKPGQPATQQESEDLSGMRLIPLKEGDICLVERRYEEDKAFDFYAGEKISSPQDVAYIFKSLEDSAVEQVFLVLVSKEGKPTIIHAGMGTMNASPADMISAVPAMNKLNPEKIYFVHNHPSGTLKPSNPDISLYKQLRGIYGGKLEDGIIIDQKSGKFARFTQYGQLEETRPESVEGKEVKMKVYSFSKNVFSKGYKFGENRLTDPDLVAEYLSAHRVGDGAKLGALFVNSQLQLVGNIALPFDSVEDAGLADYIVGRAASMSANGYILYGSMPFNLNETESLAMQVEKKSGSTIRNYDNVRVEGRYQAAESRVMEEEAEYNTTGNNKVSAKEKQERIEKLRNSKPVSITGNEIEASDDLKQYKKNALEYGKNLRGEYTNKDTGEKISLTGGNSRGGIREILQHDYKDTEHLQSIAAIPQIIENSIFIDELPNEDFEKYKGVSSFRYYVCGLKIGGVDYTVKAVVAVQNNGNRYYDHRLTSVEKGKLLDLINSQAVNGEALNPEIQKSGNASGYKDKRLISILQTNNRGNNTETSSVREEQEGYAKSPLRGKPRRKEGESMLSYNRRLKEWEAEMEEAKRTRSVEKEAVNPVDEELSDLTMEMMKHPHPMRKLDNQGKPLETDEDFNARMKDWEDWYRKRGKEISARISEIHAKIESAKAKERANEMKTVDEHLREGTAPPNKAPEGFAPDAPDNVNNLTKEEMREIRKSFQEKMNDMKILMTKEQAKKDIRGEIIERRRYIETSNLEDTFFVDEVKKAAKDKSEVLRAIPSYIEGTYQGEVTPELKKTAKMVGDWFEEVYNLMAQEGVLYDAGHVQNYVTHIWDRKRSPKEAQEKYDNYVNTMRMRSPFTRHRVIPSYAEGIAMGMKPKYDDITGIILEYGHYATETIANHRMVEFLKNFQMEVDGKPVDIIVPESVRDSNYSRMNHTALDGYKVLNTVKPIIAPVFGNQHILDHSQMGKFANKLTNLFWVNSGLMKKINLSFSFFHHGALTETAIAMMNPFRAAKVIGKNLIWDVITKGNIPAINDKEAARDAVKHLVSLGASNDYVTADVNNLTTQLYRLTKDKNIPVAKQAAYLLDFLNKGSDKILWDVIHDGYKIASFEKMAKEVRAKAKAEEWTERQLEDALDECGHLVNDTFGGLHFDILGFSPSSVRIMRALLLSPDWTLATIRQALSPLGFGRLYADEGFWKSMFSGEPSAKMRKKYGRAFWATACIFFYALMNALNAYFRAKDEDEQKEIADRMRKIDPEYKSPYELAYPDGMKWYDYTMLGNALGQQTHLFTGRYSDGTESYARWGKQFRELPELFFGRDGLSFPGPMLDKMSGKANPVISTAFEFVSGHSLSGFENKHMKDKKGWERDVARLYVLADHYLPYSIPTQEDKDFMFLDLVMPSSKGMTPSKAINYFEKGIKSGDFNYVAAVYNACVMNGLQPEKYFNSAKTKIEAEAKKNTLEGIETLQDATKAFDAATDLKERKRLLRYIEQQMGAQDYHAISQEEILQQAKDFVYGELPNASANDNYTALITSEDIAEDYRLKKNAAGLKPYYRDYAELAGSNPEAAERMLREKGRFIQGYRITTAYRSRLSKLKKKLEKEQDSKVMDEIRKLRKAYFDEMDKLELLIGGVAEKQ